MRTRASSVWLFHHHHLFRNTPEDNDRNSSVIGDPKVPRVSQPWESEQHYTNFRGSGIWLCSQEECPLVVPGHTRPCPLPAPGCPYALETQWATSSSKFTRVKSRGAEPVQCWASTHVVPFCFPTLTQLPPIRRLGLNIMGNSSWNSINCFFLPLLMPSSSLAQAKAAVLHKTFPSTSYWNPWHVWPLSLSTLEPLEDKIYALDFWALIQSLAAGGKSNAKLMKKFNINKKITTVSMPTLF